MKVLANALVLLAAISSVSAAPAPGPVPDGNIRTIDEGGFTYTGDNNVILARCNGWRVPRSGCDPGKCECWGEYGCYSCKGGRMQCQPGPESGKCWTD